MSMNLVQQQHDGMMPSLMSQLNNNKSNEEYSVASQHPLEVSSLGLSPYPSSVRQSSHYNDGEQYPSFKEFDAIVQDYLQNLSSKKRDKALIDQARYGMILQVLKDPRNTAVSTAQFRFWVKKMFQLTPRQVVCHDGKPVAMREEIYSILVRAHREAHHGGRDKTSALVRRRYSWIPKELIARFVRHCPFCISRRNGSQQSPLSLGIFLPATPPTYVMNSSPKATAAEDDDRQRTPSMITSSSNSSSASYPEEMMMMAAAAAQHQQKMTDNYGMHVSWPSQPQQPQYSNSNTNHFYSDGSYYNNTRQPSMTYTPNTHASSTSMMPVYYAQDYVKSNYPITDNNNTFIAPTPTRLYNYQQPKEKSSPSLSPSSSSTSTTSSPVNPAYEQRQSINLLSHQQSLF